MKQLNRQIREDEQSRRAWKERCAVRGENHATRGREERRTKFSSTMRAKRLQLESNQPPIAGLRQIGRTAHECREYRDALPQLQRARQNPMRALARR